MIHTYNVRGMTCTNCENKVQQLLSGIKGINNVTINLKNNEATIDMSSHIATDELKASLKNYPKYQIDEKKIFKNELTHYEKKSWLAIYKPILLVFIFITGITFLIQFSKDNFLWKMWMQNYMAAFFLVFSFFKLLDVKAFAESYSSYDIIAKRWTGWGYVYTFIELLLGIFYLISFQLFLTNILTLVIMSISIIGVLQSVFNKREIQCACLGAIFKLPMSTITIAEDSLMIVMSLAMLFL